MAVRSLESVGRSRLTPRKARGWLGVGAGVSGVLLVVAVVFGGNIWMWHDAPPWRKYTWGEGVVIPVWLHPVIRWVPVMVLVFAVMPVWWVGRWLRVVWWKERRGICSACSCAVARDALICPSCGAEMARLDRWHPYFYYSLASCSLAVAFLGVARNDWYPMVIGPSLAVVFVVMARKAMGDYRRKLWKGRGACSGCGYDLRGNRSGVCPECGEARVVEIESGK